MENQIALIAKYETVILGLIHELRQLVKSERLSATAVKDIVNRYTKLANVKAETRAYNKKIDNLAEEKKWIEAHDARKAAEYSEEVDNLAKLSEQIRKTT